MKYKKSLFSSQWRKAMNRIISKEMYFGKHYGDAQSLKGKKEFHTFSQWKKAMNEIISKEMDFGQNYKDAEIEKGEKNFNLRKLKRLVKNWKMSDVEKVYDVLSHKKEITPEEFSRQVTQIIHPIIKTDDVNRLDVDYLCDLLTKAIDKRMCQESSRYSLWE